MEETKVAQNSATLFALMADESSHVKNLEQLHIDFRVVRNGYVILRFGGIPPLQECTADAFVKAMNDW